MVHHCVFVEVMLDEYDLVKVHQHFIDDDEDELESEGVDVNDELE